MISHLPPSMAVRLLLQFSLTVNTFDFQSDRTACLKNSIWEPISLLPANVTEKIFSIFITKIQKIQFLNSYFAVKVSEC